MNGTTRIERAEKACPITSHSRESRFDRAREGVAAGVAAVLAAYLIALGFLGEPRPSAKATTLIAIRVSNCANFGAQRAAPSW